MTPYMTMGSGSAPAWGTRARLASTRRPTIWISGLRSSASRTRAGSDIAPGTSWAEALVAPCAIVTNRATVGIVNLFAITDTMLHRKGAHCRAGLEDTAALKGRARKPLPLRLGGDQIRRTSG